MSEEKIEGGGGVLLFFIIVVVLMVVFLFLLVAAKEYQDTKEREYLSQVVEINKNIGGELKIVPNTEFRFHFGVYDGKSEMIIGFNWKDINGKGYISEVPSSHFQRINSTRSDALMTVNFNLKLPTDHYKFQSNLPNPLSSYSVAEIVDQFSKLVTISMTDEQYQEFLNTQSSVQASK